MHSSLAGISIAKTILQLESPAPNAAFGIMHQPWLHMIAYELLTLRKRMKKESLRNQARTVTAAESIDHGLDSAIILKRRKGPKQRVLTWLTTIRLNPQDPSSSSFTICKTQR